MACKGDILGHWDLEWSHTWEQLREPPTATTKGINFMLKVQHLVLSLVSCGYSSIKCIPNY